MALSEKRCSKCKKVKPAANFTPRHDRPVGLYPCCKACKRTSRSRQYFARRKSAPKALWIVLAFHWAKSRASQRNIPFTLTRMDLEMAVAASKDRCAYCERVLSFQATMKTRNVVSPSVDRIVPTKGYIAENIVIACYRCNAIKGDSMPEELETMASAIRALILQRKLITK